MASEQRYGFFRRSTCRICGGGNLHPYLDLGRQPPSNDFLPPERVPEEQTFPLVVYLCTDCGLSQLVDVVSSEDIFDDYAYLSSTSKALCGHYKTMVDQALAAFAPADGRLVVDIGCNDGITLKCYPEGRFRVLGIEPSSAGDHAVRAGFEVDRAFFGEAVARRLHATHGGAALVTATNVFAHVDDIRGFAAGVRHLLADDGVFIIEFPYLKEMLDNLYFDTVYHEHLCYLAVTPLDHLFAAVGLRAFRVQPVEVGASGPALRLFVCRNEAARPTEESVVALRAREAAWGITDPAPYHVFADRVAGVRRRLLGMLADLRGRGATLGAFCAPAKGNTLLNYLGLGPADLVAVADNSPVKQGKVTPGSHIPIVSDPDFIAAGVTHALLLAWNYADFFLANADFIKGGGRFVIPLPDAVIRP